MVLSLVTLAWLACQVWVVLSLEDEAWPVTEMRFFGHGAQVDVDLELTGITHDGRTVVMTPTGFGLEPYQLDGYLSERLGPSLDASDPRDRETLAELAHIWNERHVGDEVVAIDLRLRRYPLPVGSGEPWSDIVLTWSAP